MGPYYLSTNYSGSGTPCGLATTSTADQQPLDDVAKGKPAEAAGPSPEIQQALSRGHAPS